MRPFPESLDALLTRPFLTSPDWERFSSLVQKRFEEIDSGESVLCAEVDSTDALAVVFATLLKGGGVFLGNPAWRQHEWQRVTDQAGFHKVFGKALVTADPASAKPFEDARIMIPSGGSSGVIRFCVHSLDTLEAAVESLYKHELQRSLNGFISLPVYHVSGLMPVWRALLTGGVVRFVDWKALEGGQFPVPIASLCSISLVPTQLARLARSDAGLSFLHGLDKIYIGGAKTPRRWVQFIRGEKLPVEFVYGATETAAMVLYGTRGDTDESGATWGQALPGVSVYFSDKEELIIRSGSLFRGYYPEDQAHEDYYTGDVGRWVSEGLLEVMGRKDFIINTGGKKVNPEEVESVLASLITGASAVAGLPDMEWGEAVVAVVEKDLNQAEVRELINQLSRKLASYKVPKQVITGVSIPRSGMGKVNRRRLRQFLL